MSTKDAKARAAGAAKAFEPAVEFVADLWGHYWVGAPDDGTPLLVVMKSFSTDVFDMVEQQFVALRGMPDAALALIVAQAVERSGTHSRAEVEAAIGASLP